MKSAFRLESRLPRVGTTIFTVMSRLARGRKLLAQALAGGEA